MTPLAHVRSGATSGCHCTPYRRRLVSSKAAMAAPSVDAVRRKPDGSLDGASLCDIHTT